MVAKRRARSEVSRRRKYNGSRKMREPILLVVQGMRTENDYFTSLRRKLGLSNVKIKVEADSPELMVKKTLKSIDHDKDAPFRAIYYIVDVDDTTE